jgi:hypothetical protein
MRVTPSQHRWIPLHDHCIICMHARHSTQSMCQNHMCVFDVLHETQTHFCLQHELAGEHAVLLYRSGSPPHVPHPSGGEAMVATRERTSAMISTVCGAKLDFPSLKLSVMFHHFRVSTVLAYTSYKPHDLCWWRCRSALIRAVLPVAIWALKWNRNRVVDLAHAQFS